MRDTLTNFPRNNLLTGPNHSLLGALNDILQLLELPTNTRSTIKDHASCKCGPGDYSTSPGGPITCSQVKRVQPLGTIIRKKFNKTWYEGEITKHDLISDFYHIKYTDGDSEEMTYMEVKQFKKPLQ